MARNKKVAKSATSKTMTDVQDADPASALSNGSSKVTVEMEDDSPPADVATQKTAVVSSDKPNGMDDEAATGSAAEEKTDAVEKMDTTEAPKDNGDKEPTQNGGKTASAPTRQSSRTTNSSKPANKPTDNDATEKKNEKPTRNKRKATPSSESVAEATSSKRKAVKSSESAESTSSKKAAASATTSSETVASSVSTKTDDSDMETETAKPVKKRGRKPAAVPAKTAKKSKAEVNIQAVAPTVRPLKFVSGYTCGKGVVLTLGSGDVGQLGLGPDKLEVQAPRQVENIDENLVEICAGGMHTICRGESGKVYTFGCNDEGALGRTTENEDDNFLAGGVNLPALAVGISAGDSHSAALLQDGRVFAWGTFRDNSGSMGLTESGVKHEPIQILQSKVRVVKISSGIDHLVMLTENGEIYTCGNAEQGQLGRVSEKFATRGGRRGVSNLLVPAAVHFQGKKRKFADVWAGGYATFARVQDSQDIYAFGLNNYFQLGVDEPVNFYTPIKSREFSNLDIVKISPGQHHTIALDSKGVVYACGRKEYGRLGLGTNCEDAKAPTAVELPDSETAVDVAAGSGTSVSYACTKSGGLLGWGVGTEGNLGGTYEEDQWSPAILKGKQLENRKMFNVSSGGQHVVFLGRAQEKME